MASSEGIAAAELTAELTEQEVPSSRQVRYEGRVMNIEAVQRAEKEMEEAETAVEQEHQLAMREVAGDEAALQLRLQAIFARKQALTQREADLKQDFRLKSCVWLKMRLHQRVRCMKARTWMT